MLRLLFADIFGLLATLIICAVAGSYAATIIGKSGREGSLALGIFLSVCMLLFCFFRFSASNTHLTSRSASIVLLLEAVIISGVLFFSGGKLTDSFSLKWILDLNLIFVVWIPLAALASYFLNNSPHKK